MGRPSWPILAEDGKDYETWSHALIAVAESYQASYLLHGNKPDQESISTYEHRQSKMYERLLSCTRGEAHKRVSDVPVGPNRATNAWISLELRYGQTTEANIFETSKKIFNIPQVTDLSLVDELIDETKRRVLQLKKFEIVVDPSTVVFAILQALPVEIQRHMFAVLPDRKVRTPVTNAEQRLEEIAAHCRKVHQLEAGYETAKIAHDVSHKRSRDTQVKCGNCKKTGHTEDECYLPGGGKFRQSGGKAAKPKPKPTTKSKSVCANCNMTGHSIEVCFRPGGGAHNKDKGQAKRLKPNHQSIAMVAREENAFSTECFDPASEWIIDSGATSHMTPFKEDIIDPVHCDRGIRIADGSMIKAVSSGTMICKVVNSNGHTIELKFGETLFVPRLTRRLISATPGRACKKRVGGLP